VEPVPAGSGDNTPSKPPSPKPELSLDTESTRPAGGLAEDLSASLKPLETNLEDTGGDKESGGMQLELSELGPDGVALEAPNNLSQVVPTDDLVGGNMMDQSGDPFQAT